MRYLWIELIGYAGIYNGLGLNNIKIDFTKCVHNKIVILGKNGSGKSTLMNSINPNPDSNDNFIPNIEARKSMSLLCNGTEYIINYIHGIKSDGSRATTKGYVSKCINGVFHELNPNGNISSCKDILYDELGLDSNYISLSKLSSENRGLVDAKPAERKRSVNNIISALEVYNGIYKNISKKISVFKQLIDSLTYKIDHIGDENKVSGEINNLTSRIDALNKEKDKCIEATAHIKIKISDCENLLRNNNYDELKSEYRDVLKDIKYLENSINESLSLYNIEDISKINPFIEYIKNEIIEHEKIITALKRQVSDLLQRRESEIRELEEKQTKLSSMESEYNYLELKTIYDKSKSIVNKYDILFKEMGLTDADLITREEYEAAMESLNTLLEYANNLTSIYYMEDIIFVINNRNIILEKINSIESDRINLKNLIDAKSDISKEIIIYESKRSIASELINRPSDCKIDSCIYIKSALDANKQYPESGLVSLNKRLDDLNNEINTLDNDINKNENYINILSMVMSIERELKSKMKFIKKLPVRNDFEFSFINRVCNHDQFNDIYELRKYTDYANILDEYKSAKKQLGIYEVEYKLYESKNSIIESIITDIENLNNKVNELTTTVENNNKDIIEFEIKIENLNNTLDKIERLNDKIINKYQPLIQRRDEIDNLRESLSSTIEELDVLKENLSIADNNIGSINSDIKNLSNTKESLSHSLSLLVEYKSELKEYLDKYNKLNKIKYYSSPATGIQTLFIQLYMNKILSTANTMLSLLFDGEFILQPFIINDSEFRIPCIGTGLLHDDISSMSTAQKCMISMILSFALLKESSTNYNVLCLDEIDGGLDTSNRIYFINLLDRLMSMLMCEQCFIISHNSELDTSMADLIVLKSDPGEVYYGNIIWEY